MNWTLLGRCVTLVVVLGFVRQSDACYNKCYSTTSYRSCGWWARCRTEYRTTTRNCGCCSGYSGTTCTDINECLSSTHGCQHNCKNTAGSYKCTCNAGYKLDSNARTCSDINECASSTLNQCNHNCINKIGSYECSCRSGFLFVSGSKTKCQGKIIYSKCSEQTSKTVYRSCGFWGWSRCAQTTYSTAYKACKKCAPGYTGSTDYCDEDINECSTSTHGCQQKCVNTVGSYLCACNTGYTLDSNSKTCSDINECSTSTHGCQQKCVNTVGSYLCACNTGYTLDSNSKTCSVSADPPKL